MLFGCSPTYTLQSYEDKSIGIKIEEDSAILAIIEPYKNKIEAQMNEVLTYTKSDLKKGKPESTIGNFVTDLCLNYAVADVCVMNNGGLRTKIDEGKTCIGCILNSDTQKDCIGKQSCGSHWICIFIDCRKPMDTDWSIEYFDSVGKPPIYGDIAEWIEQFKIKLLKYRKNQNHIGQIQVEINNVEHQKQNNECGVYCLYYIRARVEGIPCPRFSNRIIPDHVMINFRRHLFRG